MKNRVKEYLGLPYSTFVVPDVTTDNEPCYMAYHPELEGCMSHGSTPDEALHNLMEVTELYISALLEKGLDIPLSQGIGVTWGAWDVVSPTSQAEADMPSIAPLIFTPVT